MLTVREDKLVLPKARVVFKVMLGKKSSAVADLKRFAKNGYSQDALALARKLRLPTCEIAHTLARSAET